MNKPIRLFLLICAVLFWSVQRMPAPIEVPSDNEPAETAPKKRVVKRVPRKAPLERKPKPEVRAAQPVPEETTPPAAVAPTEVPAGAPVAASTSAVPVAAAPGVAAPAVAATIPAAGQEVMVASRRVAFKPDENTEYIYTLAATQPFGSSATGQKVRMTITESGVREVTRDKKPAKQTYTTTQTTSINTGKTKSVSQLRDLMRDAFQRFASGAVTPGQELGKIGDVRYGGELRFVAESADAMRFDYVPARPNVLRFRRIDIQKFAELLAQQ